METPKNKAGRPSIDPATRKKNRAISLTDAEYAMLETFAKAAEQPGVSAFIVFAFGLNKKRA